MRNRSFAARGGVFESPTEVIDENRGRLWTPEASAWTRPPDHHASPRWPADPPHSAEAAKNRGRLQPEAGDDLQADAGDRWHRCSGCWRRRTCTGAAFSRNGECERGTTRRERRPPRAADQQLLGHVLFGAMAVLRQQNGYLIRGYASSGAASAKYCQTSFVASLVIISCSPTRPDGRSLDKIHEPGAVDRVFGMHTSCLLAC